MRLASYNIHKCVGSDGRFAPGRVIDVISELSADVVALQEADRRFGRRTGLLDAGEVERRAGMAVLRQSDLPDGLGWHGNTLLVRCQPRVYRRRRLALPGMEPRGAVIAELDLGQGPFRLVAAHLGLLARCRSRQAGALLAALAKEPPLPTVVMGDLNEWRAGRSVLGMLAPSFGVPPRTPSFPARMPLLSLDRILGWPLGVVSDVAVHDTPLARAASDHLPLTATFSPCAVNSLPVVPTLP